MSLLKLLPGLSLWRANGAGRYKHILISEIISEKPNIF